MRKNAPTNASRPRTPPATPAPIPALADVERPPPLLGLEVPDVVDVVVGTIEVVPVVGFELVVVAAAASM